VDLVTPHHLKAFIKQIIKYKTSKTPHVSNFSIMEQVLPIANQVVLPAKD
jgi:uncharacterized Fe-S radical SAM superfamily protein PflX